MIKNISRRDFGKAIASMSSGIVVMSIGDIVTNDLKDSYVIANAPDRNDTGCSLCASRTQGFVWDERYDRRSASISISNRMNGKMRVASAEE